MMHLILHEAVAALRKAGTLVRSPRTKRFMKRYGQQFNLNWNPSYNQGALESHGPIQCRFLGNPDRFGQP